MKTAFWGVLVGVSVGLGAPSARAADSVAYAYDFEGRLVQAVYANGTKVTYAYDDAGNRTSVVVTCAGNGAC